MSYLPLIDGTWLDTTSNSAPFFNESLNKIPSNLKSSCTQPCIFPYSFINNQIQRHKVANLDIKIGIYRIEYESKFWNRNLFLIGEIDHFYHQNFIPCIDPLEDNYLILRDNSSLPLHLIITSDLRVYETEPTAAINFKTRRNYTKQIINYHIKQTLAFNWP